MTITFKINRHSYYLLGESQKILEIIAEIKTELAKKNPDIVVNVEVEV